MAEYIIKDIPDEKMREFKTACAYFKQTMRQVFMDIIDIRIEHYKADTGQYKHKRAYTKNKEAKK